jgi:hypothetical protein
MSMEWDCVSELRPPAGLLSVQMRQECREPRWNDTDRGKPKNFEKKPVRVPFCLQVPYELTGECGEPRWNYTDRGNRRTFRKNLSECHFVYKSHMDWPRNMERGGVMILTGENRKTLRKTCSSATSSNANPTWTDPDATRASVVSGRQHITWAMHSILEVLAVKWTAFRIYSLLYRPNHSVVGLYITGWSTVLAVRNTQL